MAIQSQPTRIPEPFAGSGTKNTIPATNATPSASQAASWASGFPPECSQPISAGGCPVPRNDVNGALNQLSQDYAFRQDGGVWEWSALADYDTHRMVRGSDGLLYWSVAQSGPGVAAGSQDPTADTLHDYWDQVPTDDADVVHKAGNETIAGTKTFETDIHFADRVGCYFYSSQFDPSETPASDRFSQLARFDEKNGDQVADVYAAYTTGKATQFVARLYSIEQDVNCYFMLSAGYNNGVTNASVKSGSLRPVTSGGTTLGQSSNRWGQIYSTSSTISTSDARLKTEPQAFPDEVLDAWGDVEFCQFQMLDSVAKKGPEEARLHSGLVAQRIDAAFKARGLDARRHGLFCYDAWGPEPEQRDQNGDILVDAVPAGDSYSLRYEEALCMEAAYQRRRANRAEARLAALEERLAAIEAKLNA